MPELLAPITAALGIALSVPHAATTTARGLLAPPGTCAGQERVLAPADAQVAATRCLLNWARGSAGLTRLRHVGRLDRSALLRASAIRRCGDFSHTPCGQSFIRPFVAVGYFQGRAAVGENLAWGEGELGSPRATVADWLGSPLHRQILLTREWRDLGISLVRAPRLFGRAHVTVWVAQFGRRN
jgi:uncharacterized protein YkwD